MNVLKYIENLQKEYNHKNLPEDIKREAIEIYKNNLKKYFCVDGADNPIVTFNHTLLAERYSKIVFLDYGAFLIIDEDDICWDYFVPKKYQPRLDFVYYEVENYPGLECIYYKYNKETNENSYMLIPCYKVFPLVPKN
jgi:hypothetical protein